MPTQTFFSRRTRSRQDSVLWCRFAHLFYDVYPRLLRRLVRICWTLRYGPPVSGNRPAKCDHMGDDFGWKVLLGPEHDQFDMSCALGRVFILHRDKRQFRVVKSDLRLRLAHSVRIGDMVFELGRYASGDAALFNAPRSVGFRKGTGGTSHSFFFLVDPLKRKFEKSMCSVSEPVEFFGPSMKFFERQYFAKGTSRHSPRKKHYKFPKDYSPLLAGKLDLNLCPPKPLLWMLLYSGHDHVGEVPVSTTPCGLLHNIHELPNFGGHCVVNGPDGATAGAAAGATGGGGGHRDEFDSEQACAVKKLVQALRTALLKPTQVRNTLVHEVTDYHSVPHAKSVSVQELFEEGSKKIADVARLLDELEKEVGFSAGCWLKSVQKGIHTLKQKNVLEVFEDFERLQAVDDGKPVHIPFQKCGNDLVNEKVKAVERFFFPVKSGSPTGNGVHVQVLTGMFGIGKSTTASSYAWRCVNDKRYTGGVLAISAKSRFTLIQGLRHLAVHVLVESVAEQEKRLHIFDDKDSQPEKQLRKAWGYVQRWLKARAEAGHLWLLYFDAAEHPDLIKELLAWDDILHFDRGHVLITSRVTEWGAVFCRSRPNIPTQNGDGGACGNVTDDGVKGNRCSNSAHSADVDRSVNQGQTWKFEEVALALMSVASAKQMVLQCAGWSELDDEEESAALDALVKRLAGLPLALSHAGASIRKMKCTIREYTKQFFENSSQFFTGHDSPSDQDCKIFDFSTWEGVLGKAEVPSDSIAGIVASLREEGIASVEDFAMLNSRDKVEVLLAASVKEARQRRAIREVVGRQCSSTVAMTLSLQVQSIDPMAVRLLEVLSILGPDLDGRLVVSLAALEYIKNVNLRRELAALQNASLLQCTTVGNFEGICIGDEADSTFQSQWLQLSTFRMHLLVRDFGRARLLRNRFSDFFLDLCKLFMPLGGRNSNDHSIFGPAALNVASFVSLGMLSTDTERRALALLCQQTGKYLNHQCDFPNAKAMFDKAAVTLESIAERRLADQVRKAWVFNLRGESGRLSSRKEDRQEGLADHEKALTHHQDILCAMKRELESFGGSAEGVLDGSSIMQSPGYERFQTLTTQILDQRKNVAIQLDMVGKAHFELKDIESLQAAIVCHTEVISIRDQLEKANPRTMTESLAVAKINLGRAKQCLALHPSISQRDTATFLRSAVELFADALELREWCVQQYATPYRKRLLCHAHHSLGCAYLDLEELTKAREHLETARKGFQLIGSFAGSLREEARFRLTMASLCRAENNLEQAGVEFERAFAIFERHYGVGAEHFLIAKALKGRAETLLQQAEQVNLDTAKRNDFLREAAVAAQRALEIYRLSKNEQLTGISKQEYDSQDDCAGGQKKIPLPPDQSSPRHETSEEEKQIKSLQETLRHIRRVANQSSAPQSPSASMLSDSSPPLKRSRK